VAADEEVIAGGFEVTLGKRASGDIFETDRLANPFGSQFREPSRAQEVYVGACGSGAYGDRP
jgi:hypothetical protein